MAANGETDLRLRAFAGGDLDAYLALRADRESAIFIWGTVPLPVTADVARDEVRELATAPGADVWTVADANDGPVAFAFLQRIDWINRTAWSGIAVPDRSRRGRGIGTRAMSLVLDRLFQQMDLEMVYAAIDEVNTASLRLHRRLGFEVVGRRRAMLFVDGETRSTILCALSRDAYREGGGQSQTQRNPIS